MAQSGFTPIQLYRTATASATPSAGNLADGELAINTNDGRLFYKDSGGAVQTIAWRIVPISAGGTGATTASGALTNLGAVAKAGDTMTGALAVVAGTVSAPGLTFSGDTNTGIYSPAADTIAFAEGGVEAMRLDASGNVGIGVTAPTSRLTVRGSGSSLEINQDVGSVRFSSSPNRTNNWYLGANISDSVNGGFVVGSGADISSGTPRMVIDSSGNVGIGTSSPGVRLDIVNGELRVKRAADNDAAIYFGTTFANYIYSGNTNNIMAFAVNGSERMRITAAGNVGIAVSSPGKPLSVNGDIGIAYGSAIAFNAAGAGSYTADWAIRNTWGGADQLQFQPSGNSNCFITFHTGAAAATRPERMRIDNDGNVGIGTSAPGYKTDIAFSGDNGLRIRSSTLGSYLVFENVTGAVIANSSNTPMVFTTNNLERMRISAAGNVGIGTSSPQSALDVQSNTNYIARFTGSSNGYLGATIVNSNSGSAARTYLQFGNDTSQFGAFITLNSSTNTTELGGANALGIYNGLSAPIAFATAGTERFRVGPAGQLGVGGANYGTSGQVLTSNGAGAAPSWQNAGGTANGLLLNVQVFTSSGTYTRTAGVTRAVVIAVGGGGGGGGFGSAAPTPGNGGTGGTTSFGSHVTAVGGSGGQRGQNGTGFGGLGGTGGTGALIAIRGAPGGYTPSVGGEGGGQGGAIASVTTGGAGVRGGGGSGGGDGTYGGGGGGQGETSIDYITSVGATETVTIGAGGTAGSAGGNGFAGGAGGAGYIIVYEYS